MNKPTSAREIMAKSEFTAEGPNLGYVIRFRKISHLDTILQGASTIFTLLFDEGETNGDQPKGNPTKAALKERAEERRKAYEAKRKAMTREERMADTAKQYDSYRKVVMAAAIEPRVVDCDWSGVDCDEEIHVSTIDLDLMFYAFAILHESGMILEMPDLPFFRRAVAPSDTRDGGKLRQATDGDTGAATGEAVREHQNVRGGNRAGKKKSR